MILHNRFDWIFAGSFLLSFNWGSVSNAGEWYEHRMKTQLKVESKFAPEKSDSRSKRKSREIRGRLSRPETSKHVVEDSNLLFSRAFLSLDEKSSFAEDAVQRLCTTFECTWCVHRSNRQRKTSFQTENDDRENRKKVSEIPVKIYSCSLCNQSKLQKRCWFQFLSFFF